MTVHSKTKQRNISVSKAHHPLVGATVGANDALESVHPSSHSSHRWQSNTEEQAPRDEHIYNSTDIVVVRAGDESLECSGILCITCGFRQCNRYKLCVFLTKINCIVWAFHLYSVPHLVHYVSEVSAETDGFDCMNDKLIRIRRYKESACNCSYIFPVAFSMIQITRSDLEKPLPNTVFHTFAMLPRKHLGRMRRHIHYGMKYGFSISDIWVAFSCLESSGLKTKLSDVTRWKLHWI